MIKQDKGETTLDGSLNEIISECAALTHYLAKEVEESSNSSYDKVIEQIQSAVNLYKLVDSGMTPEEAIEVLGIDSYSAKVINVDEEGVATTVFDRTADEQDK